MFDAKELPICLYAFYDAGISDEMLTLIHQAMKTNVIAVKNTKWSDRNGNHIKKSMQGDVLSPLLSSNTVDMNIGKVAKETGNLYLYKHNENNPSNDAS